MLAGHHAGLVGCDEQVDVGGILAGQFSGQDESLANLFARALGREAEMLGPFLFPYRPCPSAGGPISKTLSPMERSMVMRYLVYSGALNYTSHTFHRWDVLPVWIALRATLRGAKVI